MFRHPQIVTVGAIAIGLTMPAHGDFATLVDQTTIIDNIPIGSIGPEDSFGNPGFALNRGDGISSGFIDAAVLSYDFGTVASVLSATLTLNVDTLWAEAGIDPTIEMFAYADDGVIQLTDIFLGADTVYDSFTYITTQIRSIDVTAAVNDALAGSQYVGIRFENSRSPFELPNVLEGIHYANNSVLEFTIPGPGSWALLGLAGLCGTRRRRK